jgi:hypothetical protein
MALSSPRKRSAPPPPAQAELELAFQTDDVAGALAAMENGALPLSKTGQNGATRAAPLANALLWRANKSFRAVCERLEQNKRLRPLARVHGDETLFAMALRVNMACAEFLADRLDWSASMHRPPMDWRPAVAVFAASSANERILRQALENDPDPFTAMDLSPNLSGPSGLGLWGVAWGVRGGNLKGLSQLGLWAMEQNPRADTRQAHVHRLWLEEIEKTLRSASLLPDELALWRAAWAERESRALRAALPAVGAKTMASDEPGNPNNPSPAARAGAPRL